MAANRADFDKRLSGGAANTDPNLALGGVMSTEVVRSQSAVYDVGSILGVTVVEALGHDAANFGNGTLSFVLVGTTLQWTPLAGVAGIPVDVSVDGDFVIADANGDKYLIVTVVAASLPVANSAASVAVDELQNKLFDNVTGEEAAFGDTNYRAFYATNVNGVDNITNVRIWIENQPIGPDDLEIGLDPAGIGDGITTGVAVTIVDEDTAPVGVTFSAPADVGSALLIGNLAPGDAHAVWVKRNVPVNTLVAQSSDLSRIEFQVGLP